MALQHLRSSTAHKRPIPTVMSAGQIAINTNEASPALFFKDSNGDLVKVGPVHVGTSAPNSSPASVAATALVAGTVYQILTVGTTDFTLVGAGNNNTGTIFTATGTTTGTGTVSGQQGVEKGEMWLDTTGGTYVLKIYDGSAWRSESGTFVDSAGDTMTGALLLDNAASASAPDLSFDGDADTGVYSPGANQLALATNGAQALYINADGDILVADGNRMEIDEVRARDGAGLKLFDDAGAGIFVEDGGNVGVGTTNAGAKLHVVDNNLVGTYLTLATADSPTVSIVNQATDVYARIAGGNYATASSVNLDLASHRAKNKNEKGGWRLKSLTGAIASSGAGSEFQIVQTTYTSSDTITEDSPALSINSSNKVGIGTTTVDKKLVIAGDNTAGGENNTLRFLDTDTSSIAEQTTGKIEFYTSDTDGAGVKGYIAGITRNNGGDGCLIFGTGASGAATEKLRLDDSGRLLVGTSSARSNFFNTNTVTAGVQAEGTGETPIFAAIRITNTDTEVPVFLLAKSRGTSVGSNTLVAYNDQLGYLSYQGNDGSQFAEAARISGEVDGTPGANDMPGRLVFSTTPDGDSSPDEVMRITSDKYVRLASGTGGIQFNGDTAAANALDDYEEGTWTPGGISTTGGGSLLGKYIKVGSQVTAWVSLVTFSGTLTLPTVVTGLPYARAASRYYIGGSWGIYTVTGTSYQAGATMTATNLSGFAPVGAPASSVIDGNGAFLSMMVTYTVLS